MEHTERVTTAKEQEGPNGFGGGIKVGGGIGHGNGVRGENGEVTSDGGRTGAGTRTTVEVNEGTPEESGNGSGNGAGTETRTGRELEQGLGWRPVEEHRMDTGTGVGIETRAVTKVLTGTRMGTGAKTRTGSGRAEERRMSARNRTRLVDAISPFYSARVVISAHRGWRFAAPDSSVRKSRVYTRTSNRESNRVRGTRIDERVRGRDKSRG